MIPAFAYVTLAGKVLLVTALLEEPTASTEYIIAQLVLVLAHLASGEATVIKRLAPVTVLEMASAEIMELALVLLDLQEKVVHAGLQLASVEMDGMALITALQGYATVYQVGLEICVTATQFVLKIALLAVFANVTELADAIQVGLGTQIVLAEHPLELV